MHIFYIHSHITYVIAKLFISENNLTSDSIRFIVSRGYNLNESAKTYDITGLYNYLERSSKLNKVFNLKEKIRSLDEEIELLVDNKPYCAYLPQFNHSLFQIIGTHELCENLALVEEGITSYKLDEELYKPIQKSYSQYLSRFFSKRFLLKNSHYRPLPIEKFKYALCINERCFPFLNKKRVLKINSKIVANYKNIIENNNVVFVLDSFKERTKTSIEDYLMIVGGTLKLLNTNSIRLFVKFHPEQDESIRKETLNFIRTNFGYETIVCLNNDCILEFEFLKLRDLTVIGMHTSLLYYAKEFGHNVLSSIKLTSSFPKIDEYINHVMDKEQKQEYLNYE